MRFFKVSLWRSGTNSERLSALFWCWEREFCQGICPGLPLFLCFFHCLKGVVFLVLFCNWHPFCLLFYEICALVIVPTEGTICARFPRKQWLTKRSHHFFNSFLKPPPSGGVSCLVVHPNVFSFPGVDQYTFIIQSTLS